MAHDEEFEAMVNENADSALIDDQNFINDYYNLSGSQTQYQSNYPPQQVPSIYLKNLNTARKQI